MVIFHSYVSLPEGKCYTFFWDRPGVKLLRMTVVPARNMMRRPKEIRKEGLEDDGSSKNTEHVCQKNDLRMEFHDE